jgi:biopolymer transport protein TolQ
MTHTILFTLASFLQQPDDATPLPGAAHTSALGDILSHTGMVAYGVLALLAVLSVFSWTIMIAKYRGLARRASSRRGFCGRSANPAA